MTTLSALTAVGPAYLFPVLKSLEDSAVQAGLSPQLARTLVSQLVAGTARLVHDTNRGPDELKRMIGLRPIDESAVRKCFQDAFVDAVEKLGGLQKRLAA
jgi:pyrroline-5-carboxylate reductase